MDVEEAVFQTQRAESARGNIQNVPGNVGQPFREWGLYQGCGDGRYLLREVTVKTVRRDETPEGLMR